MQLNETMEPSEIMEELCVCYPVITRTDEFKNALAKFIEDECTGENYQWIEFAKLWGNKAETL